MLDLREGLREDTEHCIKNTYNHIKIKIIVLRLNWNLLIKFAQIQRTLQGLHKDVIYQNHRINILCLGTFVVQKHVAEILTEIITFGRLLKYI